MAPQAEQKAAPVVCRGRSRRRSCVQAELAGPPGVHTSEQRFDEPVAHLIAEPTRYQIADGDVPDRIG